MDSSFEERSELYFCVVYENLYPTKAHSRRLILDDSSIITDSDIVSGYSFFDYYRELYKNTYLDKLLVPHLVYTGLGNIRQLETMIYDKTTQDYLNQQGLEIYLYETLLFDLLPKKKFYVNDNQKYPGDYINFRFETQGSDFYCFEMESIEEFVRNNNLTKVRVYTCEDLSKELFNDKYSFEVDTREIFFESLLEVVEEHANSYQLPTKHLKETSEITHKFWSGNWRYDIHRHVIAAVLSEKSSKISWYYTNSIDQITDKFWFDITQWKDYVRIQQAGQHLSSNAPYILDLDFPAVEVDKNSLWFIPTTEFFCAGSVAVPYLTYQQCFCSVITESNYAHPLPTFSEKTVNAIKAQVPFILVSSSGTLAYLKKLGFRTFGDFWDESYDDETNHEQRLQKIIQLLDDIDSWDLDKMKSLRLQMKEILDYNYQLLFRFTQP
jgi:hypothetical protein